MSRDFFLGPDLPSLLRRYLLLTLLRSGWFFINGGFYGPSFYVQESLTPLPWGVLHGTMLTFTIVDGILALAQMGLLLGALRVLMIHHYPAQAVAWRLVRAGSATRGPRRSIFVTGVFLCSLVMLSCGLLPWAVQAWGSGEPMPFLHFLSYQGAPALIVGAFLCLLGLAWGGGHSARAASDMTASFRIVLVGEDHWLYQRVKRIADELGLPAPKVGMTNVTNAFAMGSSPQDATVIIGQPLFAMEPDELEAIIGHELGHVMSNDVQRMQFAEGFQIMLAKVISFATIVLAVFAAVAASQSKNRGINARMGFHATMGVGNALRGTVFIASELVVKGISRSREFHADAVGAQVTSTDAMVRALQRIHGVVDKTTSEERQYGYLMFRGAGLGNLFGTHPTLNARIRSLNARARLNDAAERARQAAGHVPDSTADAARPGDASETAPKPSLAFHMGTSIGRVSGKLKGRSWRMPLLAVVAAIAIVPALNSHYQLDRRASAAGAVVVGTAQSSWTWASGTVQGLADEWSGQSKALAARDEEIHDLKRQLAALQQPQPANLSETQGALAAANTHIKVLKELDRTRSIDLAAARTRIAELEGRLAGLQPPPRQEARTCRASAQDGDTAVWQARAKKAQIDAAMRQSALQACNTQREYYKTRLGL